MRRCIVFLAAACSICAAGWSAEPHRTRDGLQLTLRGDGQIAALAAQGKPRPQARGNSGLLVADRCAGAALLPAGGQVQAARGAVVHRGVHAGLNLEFEAVYRTLPGAVRILAQKASAQSPNGSTSP